MVRTWLREVETEPLEDHRARSQKGVVDGVFLGGVRLDAEGVDPDELHAPVEERVGRVGRERDVVAEERLGAGPPYGVGGAEQDPRGPDRHPGDVVPADPGAGRVDDDHDAGSVQDGQVELVGRRPPGEKVEGRVDVGAGVGAERPDREVVRVSPRELPGGPNGDPGIAGERRHSGGDRHGDVEDSHVEAGAVRPSSESRRTRVNTFARIGHRRCSRSGSRSRRS